LLFINFLKGLEIPMAQFINYNSFVILVVLVFAVAAAVLLRRGFEPSKLAGLAGVAVLLFLIYSGMRPTEPVSEQPAEIQARIGAGTPVLLEFMSPN